MRRCRFFVLAMLLPALLATRANSAQGQVQQVPFVTGVQPVPGSSGMRRYPPVNYFQAFNALGNGDYREALKLFQGSLSGAYHSVQNRWIDSICAYTMVGETQYRLGNYPAALENFEAALRLYLQYSNWMLKVQFPPTIAPSGAARPAPWGKSTRGSRPARFPDTMSIVEGQTPAEIQQRVRTGGVVRPQSFVSVQVQEIVRCTCLAMQRRRQILGPLVTRDPLTDELVGAAGRRQGPPNHWSEAWLDVQQGMAYSVAGKTGQAIQLLQRSLTMGQGQFDHPVTGLALLELGHLSLDAGDFKTAGNYFEEATYTGFDYGDSTTVEEGFRHWFLARLMAGDAQQIEGPLTLAAAWARSNLRELQASLLLLVAESLAVRGQTPQAIAILKDAGAVIGRRNVNAVGTMANCEIGSRFRYLTALTFYQQGNVAAGDVELTAALVWQKDGAKRLFQIALADQLAVSNPNGRFPARVAMSLYDLLLRDPTPTDWAMRPLESLAVMATPHLAPFEHWFELVVQQSPTQEIAAEASLEVADLARRHRFLSSLPFGGRLLALRWVLEAPEESLTKQALLQRQELLTRYPKYAEAAGKVRQLRAEITQLGLTPENQRPLTAKFTELAKFTETQEDILHEMAVRREPADVVFPPVRKTKDVQNSLPGDRLLMAFFTTSSAPPGKQLTYGWFLSHDRSTLWKVENPALLEKRTVSLLRALGNFDAIRELPESQLTDESWRQAARDVAEAIRNSKAPFSAEFKQVVIVPDGVLWYVPFELLPLGDPKENQSLLSRARIRYAPTVGLSLPAREGRKATPEIGVVLGKLFPGDAPEVAAAALEQIQRVASHAVGLRTPLPGASPFVGSMFDGLIVLDDLPANQGPFDWSPIPIEKANKNIGSLGAWLSLPWKNPDQFILPGFHTAAENGLKSIGAQAGNELFLATTGLMATGARTILISRWRTGGQTAVDLIREFVQELPFSTADEAWQRAVQLLCQSPLDPMREPRIKRKADGPQINAQHPFFWSGYLLVDNGATPQATGDENQKPALKIDLGKLGGKKAEAEKPAPKMPEAPPKPDEKKLELPPIDDRAAPPAKSK